jgi:hypothetical protein
MGLGTYSGSRGQKGTGSRIRILMVDLDLAFYFKAETNTDPSFGNTNL